MKVRNYIGLFLILAVIVGMLGFFWYRGRKTEQVSSNREVVNVRGYLGWEKKGFFEDSQVKDILATKHGLKVEILKKGSIEMVSESTDGIDYLFPSNKVALELYKTKKPDAKSQSIFFSPIVIYSWKSLIPDLVKAGLVAEQNGSYILDLDKLIKLVEGNKSWKDIGSTQLQGNINISSTDPSKSSSGNLFSALVLASIAEKSTAVTNEDFTPQIQTRLQKFFSKMGLLDSSSGDIFSKFLTLGKTTFPFAVGYESQIIESINQKTPNIDQVAILYPKSTVWAEHEFISLNSNGDKLSESLSSDTEFNDIAWQKYGLRKINAPVDKERYLAYGIAQDLLGVNPLPRVDVMQKVINLVQIN
ncbi:MAG: hypothetical protein WCK98_05285 [bacterium]